MEAMMEPIFWSPAHDAWLTDRRPDASPEPEPGEPEHGPPRHQEASRPSAQTGNAAVKRLTPWAVPALIILGWQVAAQFGLLRPQVLPAPTTVVSAAWGLLISGELWTHVSVSAWRAFVGFTIGGGIGLILGIANGLSRLS
jgi:hypothetical protein